MSYSIFLVPVVWLLKSVVYIVVFRVRTIHITYLSCLIIAGAPLLLGLIPLPLPSVLAVVVGIGLAIYLTMQYTGVPLIPDGLLIPLGVEMLFRIGIWVIQDVL